MKELTYFHGMKPGHGLNLLKGDSLANVAVAGKLTPIEFAKGQNVRTKFVRIDDISLLHKSLGIEVTASGSYMGFSANSKVDFANECNFNSHCTHILIHIQVTNAFVSMDDPVLSPDALELLKNKHPDRFRERFGDVFIVGVTTGGEYFAVYQISGTDEKEKEQVSVAVDAAFRGGFASADLGVRINTLTESSKSHLEVRAFNFQLGGSDPSTDLTPEQIMAKARNFALSVRDEFSVPYSMLPASYSELKLPDDAANPIDIENQRHALAEAWKIRNDLMVLKNDIDYILLSDARNHNEFDPFDATELTAARNGLAKQIDAITRRASQCMTDAKQCEFSQVDISTIKLPKHRLEADDALAAKGEAITNEDPLAIALYEGLHDAPSRRGFYIGMAVAEGHTLPGPNKQRFGESLEPAEQNGYFTAVLFSVDRNRNSDLATVGAAIAKATPAVAAARTANRSVFYWLGFDIATGFFGDPALGARGYTLTGDGSLGVRGSLNDAAQMGFDASVKLHLGPPPLPRRV